MSEKIKKNEKAKKQTWRAGNMLYPVPAVMVSCARKGEKPNIITVAWNRNCMPKISVSF